jgi:hypothetical protein
MSHSEEPPNAALQANWLVRAYYTPVSDALRGELSGALDARTEITSAGLPIPVAELILRVVRKARLWRAERLDVARELVAHFSDGLAAGRSPKQLVADFGDPATAARLIRKAKVRARPIWWQAWWGAMRLSLLTLAFGLLVYGVLTIRFHWGQPHLAHNYRQEINARRAAPEEKLAWPFYRDASALMGSLWGMGYDVDTMRPDDKDWYRLVADVEGSRQAIELARAGAEKPHLGGMLGNLSGEENPYLFSVGLEFANETRHVARLLNADARVAASEGDADRAMADITSMIRIAEQLFEPPLTFVEQLISMTIFRQAMNTTGYLLESDADIFSQQQLHDLARVIAASPAGAPQLDFEFERLMFDDLVQRIYTDDGYGDGRVTPEGLDVLDGLSGSPRLTVQKLSRAAHDSDTATTTLAAAAFLMGPGVGAMIGGRRENKDLYDSLFDEAIRAHEGPPWEWDEQQIRQPGERLMELTRDETGKLRYAPVYFFSPAISPIYNAVERTKQMRDAVEVAIALTIWKKQHGAWPKSLDELVPDLLAEVPPDRLDGKPLRYALRDGKPVLYSIGNDRDDDGGRNVSVGLIPEDVYWPAAITFARPSAEQLNSYNSDENDGDWILWPPSAMPVRRHE